MKVGIVDRGAIEIKVFSIGACLCPQPEYKLAEICVVGGAVAGGVVAADFVGRGLALEFGDSKHDAVAVGTAGWPFEHVDQ